MKRLVPLLVMALGVASCGSSPNGTPEAVGAPIIRLPVIPGRPGAAYFDIMVPSENGALLSVTSPQVGRIEMHETMQQGTMTSMRPVARLSPEGGRILFQPGGRHLMLFDIDSRLAPGGTARLVLHFEHGQSRNLDATVTAPDGSH